MEFVSEQKLGCITCPWSSYFGLECGEALKPAFFFKLLIKRSRVSSEVQFESREGSSFLSEGN